MYISFLQSKFHDGSKTITRLLYLEGKSVFKDNFLHIILNYSGWRERDRLCPIVSVCDVTFCKKDGNGLHFGTDKSELMDFKSNL